MEDQLGINIAVEIESTNMNRWYNLCLFVDEGSFTQLQLLDFETTSIMKTSFKNFFYYLES